MFPEISAKLLQNALSRNDKEAFKRVLNLDPGADEFQNLIVLPRTGASRCVKSGEDRCWNVTCRVQTDKQTQLTNLPAKFQLVTTTGHYIINNKLSTMEAQTCTMPQVHLARQIRYNLFFCSKKSSNENLKPISSLHLVSPVTIGKMCAEIKHDMNI